MQDVIDSQYDESEASLNEEATHEWLSFKLANMVYGVDILRVREIRTWQEATRVPFAPHYVSGLINLRGAIVPVVDIRLRLGLEPKSYDQETVILILDVRSGEGTKTVGAVVDAISEVVAVKDSQLHQASQFDLAISPEFVAGISDDKADMLILLNVDNLLAIEF